MLPVCGGEPGLHSLRSLRLCVSSLHAGMSHEQYKQIGNAVPVVLAEKVLWPILRFMYERGLYG